MLRRRMLLLAATLTASFALADTVDVPMRDGVDLATDVWLPAGAGPFPTILRRTPYGRALDPASVEAVNNLGYAFVSQDVRGRGDSHGQYAPFFSDADDGADTVGWLTAQSWSDGHVAMYGGSAESIVQLLAAGEGPVGLDALNPYEGTPDVRRSLFPGGAWRKDLTTDWLASLGESSAEDDLRANEADSAWWDPVRLDATEYARTDAAMLLVAGFFDIFESEMPAIPAALHAQGQGDDVWLILGPWTHGGAGVTAQGEVEFPDAIYADYYTELFALYDYRLRGAARPTWAPVRYAVSTFANRAAKADIEWVDADTWPPPSTPERLYLGDPGLGGAPGGSPVALAVDPDDPVPSVGGGNLNSAAGVYDQTAVDARADVATFATAPSEDTVTVAGDLSATIWAASATSDVDVIARVEVVTPGGSAWLVGDGVRRGRFVGGEDAIRPLTPGEPVAFSLDLGPIAVTLPPGHTLRIAISGSLYPRYERNPGEAVPIADHPEPVPTTLTIYRDDAHPSSIVVPMTAGTLGGGPVDVGDTGAVDSGTGKPGTSGCGCATASRPGEGPAGAGGSALVGLVGLALVRRRQ